MGKKYYFHVVFQGDDWYGFAVELQFEVLTFKDLSSHTSAINLSLCNHVLVSLLHIYSDTCPLSEGSCVGQKTCGSHTQTECQAIIFPHSLPPSISHHVTTFW